MTQFSLSPSITVKESDLSRIIPSVATSIGAYAGTFNWGPAFQVKNIISEENLRTVFGDPTDENATDWFCAQDFLSYSAFLKTVRIVDSSLAKNAVAAGTPTLVLNDADFATQGLTALASNKSLAKYAGIKGNGLELHLADADTFINWKYRGSFSSASAPTVSKKTTAFVGTGVVTLGSTTVSNISITSGSLAVGQPIVASGIPVGSKITAVVNTTTVTISNAATSPANGSVVALTSTIAYVGTATLATTVNSAAATLSGAELTLVAGAVLTGATASFAAGTYVVSVSGTAVVLSTPALATTPTQAFSVGVNVTGLVETISTFPGAPNTSSFALTAGGQNDELCAVVVDGAGLFTGTKGAVLEKFTNLSKAVDAKSSTGAQNYYLTAINNGSAYVWITAHETATAASVTQGSGSVAFGSVASSKFGSFSAAIVYTLANGVTSNSTITDAHRISGYAMFKDPETIDVTIIIGGVCSTTVAAYINDQVCTARKDCIGTISPPLAAVNGNTGNEERDVLAFRNSLNSSTYIFCDSGWKEVYDRYNDKYRFIPLNPSTAGLMALVDLTNDTWWSPAGFNRGFIKNCTRVLWNPTSKATRDNLYQLGVNPVVTFPGVGTVLYGDKTMVTDQSAFSRINVRRLFILLEKSLASYSKFVLFEFNDVFTRARFTNTVTPYLRDIQGRRGIYDFKVIADETVNTPEVIDSNGFRAKFYIQPARSISFIELEFVATATGASFTELA